MATITIRQFDDELRDQLRMRAAKKGHSMEEEARCILRQALRSPSAGGLATRINRRFAAIGGVDLDLPERSAQPRHPELEP